MVNLDYATPVVHLLLDRHRVQRLLDRDGALPTGAAGQVRRICLITLNANVYCMSSSGYAWEESVAHLGGAGLSVLYCNCSLRDYDVL